MFRVDGHTQFGGVPVSRTVVVFDTQWTELARTVSDPTTGAWSVDTLPSDALIYIVGVPVFPSPPLLFGPLRPVAM